MCLWRTLTRQLKKNNHPVSAAQATELCRTSRRAQGTQADAVRFVMYLTQRTAAPKSSTTGALGPMLSPLILVRPSTKRSFRFPTRCEHWPYQPRAHQRQEHRELARPRGGRGSVPSTKFSQNHAHSVVDGQVEDHVPGARLSPQFRL